MKDSWLTILVKMPLIHEIAEKLCDADFEVHQLPNMPSEWEFQVKCNICGRGLHARLYNVESSMTSEGNEIIESCTSDTNNAGVSKGREAVLQHLEKAKAVVKSSITSNLQCDCDYRFHQAIATGAFLWYVDGLGFADDVEIYLEL